MKREVIEGTIQGNERGYAFLLPVDKTKNDYFISHGDLKGAMHGDLVLAETTEGVGDRTTARVLKVITRGITQLVGTYFSCKNGGFVSPDDKKYFSDIFIPFGKGQKVKSGDKVVAKILSYPKKKSPEGIVTKVLGRQFEKKAELNSILFNYKLPKEFSMAVVDEVNGFSQDISKKELLDRKDLRSLTTFTIDGEDARDFDDAVSIEKIKDGYYLGVHIADVSHYVTVDSEVDEEAFYRGTSVYFPEKVIPMLPERLCNDLCSLREGVDRLTLSCLMKVDKNGKVFDYEITPSVIRSSARTTYNEISDILDGNEKAISKRKNIYGSILLMDELADILIEKRDRNGCIDLDVKESEILVDKNGKITVKPLERNKARRIIEEFMILANVTVAEFMFFTELPFVYRIHEKPTVERVDNFYNFLSGLGVSAKRKKDEVFPKDFQSILKKYQDTRFYTLINRVMLRSMQKAKYSSSCDGHFGLSEKYYCHFTSPIRRYPDLAIQRIIKDFIKNGSEGLEEKYGQFVVEVSSQSSEREKIAVEAERAVDDYYKLLYISDHIGEEFLGTVSGVINAGIFVETDEGVEGFIRAETLKGNRLKYNKDNFTLTDGKVTYKLGERVKIKVVGVNLVDRKAEYILVEKVLLNN